MASRLQLSCWQLTQVLRLACRYSNFLRYDCVQGPHKWYALPGQALKPRDPKAVDVFDERGEQSGCNSWAGLRRVEEELNDRYWRDSPWVDHACDQCRKYTPIEGQDFWTQAAAIDGIRPRDTSRSASVFFRRRMPYSWLVLFWCRKTVSYFVAAIHTFRSSVWVRPLQTLPRTLHSGG